MQPITANITGKVDSNPLHIAPIFAEINVTKTIKLVTNSIFTGSSHAAVNGLTSGANCNLLDAHANVNKTLSEITHASAILMGNTKINTLNKHHSVNAAKRALITEYFVSIAA
ncbi:hypothetical protein PCA01_20260 [Pseudoalteromonas carrageenovora]|nr:hypothetical protein PCA01_20260 [Pseudoalteromonas carrageenovora]